MERVSVHTQIEYKVRLASKRGFAHLALIVFILIVVGIIFSVKILADKNSSDRPFNRPINPRCLFDPKNKECIAPLTAPPTPSPKPILKGDVNGDRKVDAIDALCILRFVAGLPATTFCPASVSLDRGDVAGANGPDGKVDATDALCILRNVAGMPGTTACPTLPSLGKTQARPPANAAAASTRYNTLETTVQTLQRKTSTTRAPQRNSAADSGILVGDVNGDGKVDSVDALCIQRYLNGLSTTSACSYAPVVDPRWDVNGDGIVSSVDLLCLFKKVGGTSTAACSNQPAPAGDVNSDEKVDSVDALCMQRYFGGMSPTNACPNDIITDPSWNVNGDGKVDSADSQCVLSNVAGKPETATCPVFPLSQ